MSRPFTVQNLPRASYKLVAVVCSCKPRIVFVCGGLVVAFGGMFYKGDKCVSATASVETMKCFQYL